jgi:hypothetical protein
MFVQFRTTTAETNDTVGAGIVWEIPILDGFSFSASTNTSEVTLSEMESGGVSRRGRKMFTDSIAPAEWSISTYIRPFKAKASGTGVGLADDLADQMHLVDEPLWAHMFGADTYDAAAGDASDFTFLQGSTAVTDTASTVGNINPTLTNLAALHPFTIYFLIDESTNDEPLLYKLPGSVVNECSIDFDVEGIATTNWSGFSKEIIDFSGHVVVNSGFPAHDADTTSGPDLEVGDIYIDTSNVNGRSFNLIHTSPSTGSLDANDVTQAIDEATTSTKNFIRNKLSSITVTSPVAARTTFPGGSGGTAGLYSLPLTGGNWTFSNNITFLTPEELGTVNKPLEHVTGTRTVTGSATCYLALDTTYTTAANKGTSRQFFNNLTSTAAMAEVVNSFEVVMNIGATTADTARMAITMGTCHFEVPSHNIEDVISLETSFHALPSDFGTANEISDPIVFDSVNTY